MRKRISRSRRYVCDLEPVVVAGIPALAEIKGVNTTPGCSNPYLVDTPEEYYGSIEFSFDLYDRRGYRAPWLERKLDDKDVLEDVEKQILRKLENQP